MSKREAFFEKVFIAENIGWSFHNKINNVRDKRMKSVLDCNKTIKNIHQGKTCFILGNGPSLKYETRLAELQEHVTMTVNQMYRSPIFEQVHSDYHVLMDPLFFDLNKDDPVENDTLVRLSEFRNSNSDMRLILPYYHYDKIQRMGISKETDMYIYPRRNVTRNETNKAIELSAYCPIIQNVIQAAIYTAIYMGFSRIVLLGVDMTDILGFYIRRKPVKEAKSLHIYQYSKEEQARMDRVHAMYDNYETFKLFTDTFRIYKWIANYCLKHGVQVLNASQETALDCFEYTSLDCELDAGKE